MSKKIHDFKIDKNILYSIISKQAGTIQKAFLELTMNSIDAGASEIRMEFDGENFSFSDNGKGFESEEEIHKFFGTFGTPHQEGDATYGKFRMGRGQIMAFSHNVWKSNTFYMDVDIKNRGINYIFESNQEKIEGCLITGELYTKLEELKLKEFESEFEEFIKFSQIPVFYNGKLISKNISNMSWDKETDYGYIKIDKEKRTLDVYNLGVKVTEYHSYYTGFGGIIVSKKPLEVNFARNDILKESCEVWKKLDDDIKEILKEEAKKSIEEFKTLSDAQRASLSKKFITGEIDYILGRRLKLFKDVRGIYYTLSKIAPLETVSISSKYDLLGDLVHGEKRAFVFDKEVLENFGVKTLTELYSSLTELSKKNLYKSNEKNDALAYSDYSKLSRDRVIMEDISIYNKEINTNYIILKDDEITRNENIVLEVVKKHQSKILRLLNNFIKEEFQVKTREIKIGTSELAEAWTDAKTYIAIHREYMVGTYGVASFLKICNLILHEYIHRECNEKSHSHNAEFYEIYHRASQHFKTRYKTYYYADGEKKDYYYSKDEKDSLGYIATAMTKTYIGILEKNNLRVPKGLIILSSKMYKEIEIEGTRKRMPFEVYKYK